MCIRDSDYYMLRNGAEALSFETIAVSGVNSSMPFFISMLFIIDVQNTIADETTSVSYTHLVVSLLFAVLHFKL